MTDLDHEECSWHDGLRIGLTGGALAATVLYAVLFVGFYLLAAS